MHIFYRINSFILLSCIGLSANAQLLPPPAVGEYQIKGEFNYFHTDSNFESDGGNTALEHDSELTTMMGTGEFIIDITQRIRLQAGFTGGQTDVRRWDSFEGESTDHNNIGISEVWVRGQYWWDFWGFDIVPDGTFAYPTFRVSNASGDPLVGEGTMRLRAGGWLIYPIGDFYPFAFAAYEYRDSLRSAQMPFSAGVQWAAPSDWWIQVEVRGHTQLSSDADDNIDRRDFLEDVQGGSYRYYAVNSNSMEAAAMAGMHFGQFGIYFGIANTFQGHNAAQGFTGTAGVTFDGTFFAPTPYMSPSVDTTLPKEDKFKVKKETYDESLFNESGPSKPAPQPEMSYNHQRRRSRLRPKPRLRPVPADNGTLPTVDLILKDTQKSLEKK